MSKEKISKLKNTNMREIADILRDKIYEKTTQVFSVQTVYTRRNEDTWKCIDIECLSKHFGLTEETVVSIIRGDKYKKLKEKSIKTYSEREKTANKRLLSGMYLQTFVDAIKDGYYDDREVKRVMAPENFSSHKQRNSFNYKMMEYLAEYFNVGYTEMRSILMPKVKK